MKESLLVETHYNLIPFEVYVVDVRTLELVFLNVALRNQRGAPTRGKCYRSLFGLSEPCPFCRIKDLVDADGRPNRVTVVFEHYHELYDRWYQIHEKAIGWPDGRTVKTSIAVDISELKETQNRLAEAHAKLALKTRELVTEVEVRRKAEEAAITADRAKSEFIAAMSHELRTPLHTIIGFTDLLLEGVSGHLNEEQTEYLGHILYAGEHLLQLINDILDLAKVESGRMELRLSAVDAGELLNNCIFMIKEKAARHGITLQLDIDENLSTFPLVADAVKFKQIVFNLLSNAVNFTSDGGRIQLQAHRHGKEVLVSVTDNGIGISPENRDRIFGAFEQVNTSPGGKALGTGLGLTLARRMVELHGGRIWVESEGEGKGSTFSFLLPTHPEPQPRSGLAR